MALLVAGLVGCSFGFALGIVTVGFLVVSVKEEREALSLCIECGRQHAHYCAHCVGEAIVNALGRGVHV